eukprot:CAMPEP_0179373834 /NCGR_PEP_ID=MMETSP0797-20121207/86997_1 /TAXON_ID=47934 /ORGANISM="Dinophysis acuminata, Strain DAEP01" /LENGTH=142 /DNA_ID=CAMNT_0021089833 /DNA_START=257 /DNA_END=685 /DNA_ORIENTATION=-
MSAHPRGGESGMRLQRKSAAVSFAGMLHRWVMMEGSRVRAPAAGARRAAEVDREMARPLECRARTWGLSSLRSHGPSARCSHASQPGILQHFSVCTGSHCAAQSTSPNRIIELTMRACSHWSSSLPPAVAIAPSTHGSDSVA